MFFRNRNLYSREITKIYSIKPKSCGSEVACSKLHSSKHSCHSTEFVLQCSTGLVSIVTKRSSMFGIDNPTNHSLAPWPFGPRISPLPPPLLTDTIPLFYKLDHSFIRFIWIWLLRGRVTQHCPSYSDISRAECSTHLCLDLHIFMTFFK